MGLTSRHGYGPAAERCERRRKDVRSGGPYCRQQRLFDSSFTLLTVDIVVVVLQHATLPTLRVRRAVRVNTSYT
eukprot:scaffold14740_cov107-Isochrysis_galbana.AAC.2